MHIDIFNQPDGSNPIYREVINSTDEDFMDFI